MKTKEYTLNDFEISKIIDEGFGSWTQYPFNKKGQWEINLSSILSKLIKIAGNTCNYFASDLFIEWKFIENNLENYEFDGGKFFFGFRENGIDGNTFILSRINNRGIESIETEIKELYMIEFSVKKYSEGYSRVGNIECRFGKVKIVD